MLHVLLSGLPGSDRTCLESEGPEVDQCDSTATFDVAAFDSLIRCHHPGGTPVVLAVNREDDAFGRPAMKPPKGAGPQVKRNQSGDDPCCTVSLLLHVAKARIENKKASKSS